MKRISLLVLGLLLAVNSGSCWRRRRSRPPPPPPIHGGWSGWGPFEVCTEKCGGGTQTQYRQCNNPRPGNGGSSCSGSYTNTINCNTHPCPVHGGWTAWDEYGSCGKSCGGGTQYRRRTCTNPSPAHEGEDCLGASVETRSCNTQPCPVHGGWSGWGPFEDCTEKCGGGTQSQYRECNNPRPGNGGSSCSGPYINTVNCNTHPCPVHGAWSEWGEYGDCSRQCGGGNHSRSRQCTNPSPAHGGLNCSGVSSESKSCNTQPCPVHGAWSEWGEYGDCSRLCGGGIHSRSRQCNNPFPAHGGLNCSGLSSESRSCNVQHCLLCYRSWMSCARSAFVTAVVVMQHISVLTICFNTVSSILFISSQF